MAFQRTFVESCVERDHTYFGALWAGKVHYFLRIRVEKKHLRLIVRPVKRKSELVLLHSES